MPAPQKILDLIATFERNADHYTATPYKEAMLRQQFVNPLFESLGWDMENKQGNAPNYQDVIHEDAIKIGGATKAPDYSFGIGKDRKFFVEAKKPSVKIKDDAEAAYQLRRYAWTRKLPLSILTNFREFAVYDGRTKPNQADKASVARVRYLTLAELASQWDDIAATFSKAAVLKGSFDKFADTAKAKRGTATVDAAFLAEIEGWRLDLAKNLAIRNPDLSQRDLNYAVQVTIDRIIFLRMCEDRGIEEYGRLRELPGEPDIYDRLKDLFRQADRRYNSGLFYFKKDADHSDDQPDTLTPRLTIDDKPLKEIIGSLYYPEGPYEFSVLPAEILGQVYEQFLGKVIRLTAGHQAKVEDKPEVKKAGGVYYTPKYIVDYIVKHTVGRLLDPSPSPSPKRGGEQEVPPSAPKRGGEQQSLPLSASGRGPGGGVPEAMTPKQAAKLRILDPACGSGSFLLGAYEYLLDWHRDWYEKHDPEKHPKAVYRGPAGWRLTTAEKKRILVNNIYGVDIDQQAVEVTKLSLLLKVLEGESQDTLQKHLFDHHERALPDLATNIKCGNSLIGPDFYDGQQLTLFDEEERYRINVFDWNAAFPAIMKAGGFDAVIGNPPYVRIQVMKEWAPVEVEFYKERYRSAGRGNYDIYLVFVDRGLSLLNRHGQLGMILPHKFFNSEYGGPLREMLADGKLLSHVVHFGANQVFQGATTYTCLIFLDKGGSEALDFAKVGDLTTWRAAGTAIRRAIPLSSVGRAAWSFAAGPGAALFDRLNSESQVLGDVADVFVGVQTSADDVYILELLEERGKVLRLRSKILQADFTLEKGLFFPLASGTDVRRYASLTTRQFLLFPYDLTKGVRLVPFPEIAMRFPKTADYLLKNKKRLEERENGRMRGSGWHAYVYLKNMNRQRLGKICIPRLVDHLYAALDADGNHFLDNVDVGGITFKPAFESHGPRYLLGLLNSKLLRWFFPYVSAPFRGGWLSANRQFLSRLPIRLSDSLDGVVGGPRHDRIVGLVDRMLALHQQLAKAKSPNDQAALQSQITATDRQIDQLVYELYGLTEEEIRIVEEGTAK